MDHQFHEAGDGVQSTTATAADKFGNLSAASPAMSVTIDTVAPAAPSAPDLTAVSDTGVSNTDNITNLKTPTFTGTAEAGTTVAIYNGTTKVGTGIADAKRDLDRHHLVDGEWGPRHDHKGDGCGGQRQRRIEPLITIDAAAPARRRFPIR